MNNSFFSVLFIGKEIRWLLFIAIVGMMAFLYVLNVRSNKIIGEYTDLDFKLKHTSRAIFQIRSSITMAGFKCSPFFEQINENNENICLDYLDSASSQIPNDLSIELTKNLNNRVQVLYDLIEGFKKSSPDRKSSIQELFFQSIDNTYSAIGTIESDYRQKISDNYSFLSRTLKEHSLQGSFAIVGTMFLLIIWILQLYSQDRTDEKLRIAQLAVEEQRAKLVQSSRLSFLGEMAAGVAHEINNPLTVIDVSSSSIKKTLADPQGDRDKLRENIERIHQMSKRISRIIKGMKNFSRDVETEPKEMYSLDKIISESLVLCESRFKNENTPLTVEAVKDIEVYCSPTQISQVIVNLLYNSFDAVQSLPEKWIRLEVVVEGDNIIVSVIDSGKDLKSDIRDKMFHPFFTTKEVGKGTGLGLSISRGLIEKHGGRLDIDTQSENTKIFFEIPIKKLS